MQIVGTKGEWREFVDTSYERPPLITIEELEGLPSGERAMYNEARARYSQAGAFAVTPQYRAVRDAVRDRVMLNRYRRVGKLGVILSGDPGNGKTTTLQQIGKDHELRRRETGHPSAAEGMIPVVYVDVPAQCSARALLSEFARFLGLPVLARMTYNSLVDMVSNAMQQCATELILIDDIHRLVLRNQFNHETSDMLKSLSERCGGTFVYAGIDVESTGMLTDVRAGQISKRFALYAARPYGITSKAGRADWGDLLVSLEDSLCLLRQEPKSILSVAKELHVLHDGEIGRVKDTLQTEALHAIEDGNERLDLTVFKRMASALVKAGRAARAK